MLTFVVQSHRGVEQLVARRAHNPEAGGSSPSPATKKKTLNFSASFFAYCCAFFSETWLKRESEA